MTKFPVKSIKFLLLSASIFYFSGSSLSFAMEDDYYQSAVRAIQKYTENKPTFVANSEFNPNDEGNQIKLIKAVRYNDNPGEGILLQTSHGWCLAKHENNVRDVDKSVPHRNISLRDIEEMKSSRED